MSDLLIWGLSPEETESIRKALPEADIHKLLELPSTDWSAPLLVGNREGLSSWLETQEEHTAPILFYGGWESALESGIWAYCDDLVAPQDWGTLLAFISSPHLVTVREAACALHRNIIQALPNSIDEADIMSLPIGDDIKTILREDGQAYGEFIRELESYRDLIRGMEPVSVTTLLAVSFAGLLAETRQQMKDLVDVWKATPQDLQVAFAEFLNGLAGSGWAPMPHFSRNHTTNPSAEPPSQAVLLDSLPIKVTASQGDYELELTVEGAVLKIILQSGYFEGAAFRLRLIGPGVQHEWMSDKYGVLLLPISSWLNALAEGVDTLEISPNRGETERG